MTERQELELALTELRDAFTRVTKILPKAAPNYRINKECGHTRVDQWLQRFSNEVRNRAAEHEIDMKENEHLHCTRGACFCRVHQGQCQVHYYRMGDGKCTCRKCLPSLSGKGAGEFLRKD